MSKKMFLSALIALTLQVSAAWAQSSPGLAFGQVPTAAQWNSYFAAKIDYLGFTPLNPSSLVGTTPISVASGAGITTISLAACSANGQVLLYTASAWACSAAPSLGVAGTAGSLSLNGATSGTATISVSATGGTLNLATGATIDASGNITGTTLVSSGSVTGTSILSPLAVGGSAAGSTLTLKSTSGTGTTDAIIFQVGSNGATEGLRIVTGGQTIFGHTASLTLAGITPRVQLNSTAGVSIISQQKWSADANGSGIAFQKSRGASVGTETIVQNGDGIGSLFFRGSNGTDMVGAATISAEIDGTPGSGNDMPGRLLFLVTPDGSGTPTERMKISNTGHTNWTGTAPGLTSCGTSPTISASSNDSHGTVTMGTATPSGCVITFALAYTTAPSCRVTWRTNIASMQYTVSTSAITLTQTPTSSNLVDYNCWGT